MWAQRAAVRVAGAPWRRVAVLLGFALLVTAIVLALLPPDPPPALRVTGIRFADATAGGGHRESADVAYRNESDRPLTIAPFFATQFLPATMPVEDGARSVRRGVAFSSTYYRKIVPARLEPHQAGWVAVTGPLLDDGDYRRYAVDHTLRFYAAGLIRTTDATGAGHDTPFCAISDGRATSPCPATRE